MRRWTGRPSASRNRSLGPKGLLGLMLLSSALSSCSGSSVPAPPPPPPPLAAPSAAASSGEAAATDNRAVPSSTIPAADRPVGDQRAERIEYEFAIYYLPKPTKDPLAELKSLLAGRYRFFTLRERTADEKPADADAPAASTAVSVPSVAARIEPDVQAEYAPPDPDLLARFGHGLSSEQADQLMESEQALILEFSYSGRHVWNGLKEAQGLVADLANATGGLIWDEETREVFAPAAWSERLAAWTGDVPDLSKHTVIHAYKKDEFIRAITLGMTKFGLPDLVVDNFSWSLSRNTGHLLNLFAQALAEGAVIAKPGEFDLDLKSIRNPQVREEHLPHLLENATGVALLTLKKGTWEEGDPKNRLIELTFDRGTGPDPHARHEAVVSKTFGSSDSVTKVAHDDAELEAASARARKKLPALRTAFNKGLEPGETLLLKAPFATPDDSQEWMWVEVTRWKGDAISGLLMNEPHSIPDLHAGQKVQVSEAKIFDYIRRLPNGTVEGNETGEVIARQQQKP
ncbi:DUF2314 domain-containing protein [Planctomyces sp. SH-PL14]|uniref:DUF2314 domain-containing protein n=1 Tax=Planctomyces sp. SH-PL14 TaxID=1632864 RepID=UPI00078BF154|nr:DUF2314 domain-containing protein [Planctomyces sp. SH-PL14]AMV19017.1 hypothetical protein VT03_14095 [Planctomyces sp. SH-PL14]